MQIRTPLPSARSLRRPLKQDATPPAHLTDSVEEGGWTAPFRDASVVFRLLGIGQLYRMKETRLGNAIAKNPPLKDAKPVQIEQPVVFVPGWKTTRDAFDPIAAKLLEGGRNGGRIVFVKEGEFYLDRACSLQASQSVLESQDHKVFEMVWSDVRLPPDQSSKEMATNMQVVKQYSGADKVDVTAYSMGGLATRAYLDAGGNDIDQVMFVGTPHRGAKFADLARHVLRRDIGWAVGFAGLLAADLPALDWLSPEADGNPQLEKLNQRWPQQKAQVNEASFIGGVGTMTADGGWWPITDGDGLVSYEGAAPPGETAFPLPGGHHTYLNNDPVVYDRLSDYFHWKPAT